MSLPKLTLPTVEVNIPTLGKKAKFRLLLVKEEKVLLMAKESKEQFEMFRALKTVCENCCLDKSIKFDDLALIDIEWIFMQIRASSISDVVTVSYQDHEDDKNYDVEVKLADVKIKGLEEMKAAQKVQLTDDVFVTLRLPPISMYINKDFFEQDQTKVFDDVLKAAIDRVYQGDQIFDPRTAEPAEYEEFIMGIPAKAYAKISKFLKDVPTLHYEIKYTNSKGTERKFELETLDDFFSFG